MADISTYLKQILSAVYGEDVRQAIHDAIQQCYEDGSAVSDAVADVIENKVEEVIQGLVDDGTLANLQVETDTTLSESGVPADAAATGEAIQDASGKLIAFPTNSSGTQLSGELGTFLISNGDGTASWAMVSIEDGAISVVVKSAEDLPFYYSNTYPNATTFDGNTLSDSQTTTYVATELSELCTSVKVSWDTSVITGFNLNMYVVKDGEPWMIFAGSSNSWDGTDKTDSDLSALGTSGFANANAETTFTFEDPVQVMFCARRGNATGDSISSNAEFVYWAVDGLTVTTYSETTIAGTSDESDSSTDTDDSTGVSFIAPWDTVIHRGWTLSVAENTLPAFYLTKQNGYDWAECDLRVTSDGVIVLSHDATVTGTNADGNEETLTVASSTIEELQALILEESDTFGNITVTTFEKLLEMASIIDLGLVLDIKVQLGEDYAKLLAKNVLDYGMQGKVVYMPKTTSDAAYIATVDRNASFDFVIDPTTSTDLTDYIALLTGSNTVAFDIQASTTDANGGVDEDVIDYLRSNGLSVSFWNIRSTAYISYMDARPLRLTKQSGTNDALDLDTAYFESISFFE